MITKLYNGSVLVDFQDKGHSYKVSVDGGKTWEPKKGVTTILKDTIMKPGLMLWPMNECLKYIRENVDITRAIFPAEWEATLDQAAQAHILKRDKGGNTGTEIHAVIEGFLRHELDLGFSTSLVNISPEAAKALDAFTDWYNQNNVKPLAVEQVVYSKSLDYAGKFDCLLDIDGKTVLVDIKSTASGIWPDNYIQLGAYSLAHHEDTFTCRTCGDNLHSSSGECMKSTYKSPMRKDVPGIMIDDLLILNVPTTGKITAKYASELGLTVGDCEEAFRNTINLYRFLKPLGDKLSPRKRI